MSINLSEQSLAWAHQQATLGGFESVEEYLELLLHRERYRSDPDLVVRELAARDGEEPSSVSSIRIESAKRHLEELLREGLESGPATPMTPDVWADLRRRVNARLGGTD